MNSQNQYGGFNYNNTAAAPGVATLTQPAVGQPGAAPIAMMPMSGLPPDLTCALSMVPVTVQCPFCHSMTTTSIEAQAGLRAKLFACSFVLSGLCCLIPLCWNNFKDTVHYCGSCDREIGRCARAAGGNLGGRRGE